MSRSHVHENQILPLHLELNEALLIVIIVPVLKSVMLKCMIEYQLVYHILMDVKKVSAVFKYTSSTLKMLGILILQK